MKKMINICTFCIYIDDKCELYKIYAHILHIFDIKGVNYLQRAHII